MDAHFDTHYAHIFYFIKKKKEKKKPLHASLHLNDIIYILIQQIFPAPG